MDILSTKASAVTYSGAAASVGSGALVIFGLGQVEIAFISMVIGAFVGIGGLIANVIFKWLAHKELCRMNDAKQREAAESFYDLFEDDEIEQEKSIEIEEAK